MSTQSSTTSHSRTPSLTLGSTSGPLPDLPPATAALALRLLVASELRLAGFEASSGEAIEELEGLVFTFFESLVRRSHEYANLGRRTAVNVHDIVAGCQELDVSVEQMRGSLGSTLLTPSRNFVITYEKTRKEIVEPRLDEYDEPDTPNTSSSSLLAPFLPPLPRKHAYKQTPVYPISEIPPLLPSQASATQQPPSSLALSHLSTLRSRLNDSEQVRSSLRSLIRGIGLHNGRVEGEGEEGDVVSYEREWYAGATVGGKGGRGVRVLREGEGREEGESRGGGGKRVKWRV